MCLFYCRFIQHTRITVSRVEIKDKQNARPFCTKYSARPFCTNYQEMLHSPRREFNEKQICSHNLYNNRSALFRQETILLAMPVVRRISDDEPYDDNILPTSIVLDIFHFPTSFLFYLKKCKNVNKCMCILYHFYKSS